MCRVQRQPVCRAVDRTVPLSILRDNPRIRQILLNLVGNATTGADLPLLQPGGLLDHAQVWRHRAGAGNQPKRVGASRGCFSGKRALVAGGPSRTSARIEKANREGARTGLPLKLVLLAQ